VKLPDVYRRFASFEARGESECYVRWAEGVAGDPELLALIDELGGVRRQPQLVFAAARLVGITPRPFEAFRAELVARWPDVRRVALSRRNQTNEVGRCSALLPVLAALPQPLALLEVGCSAGLCLYPDRYSYRYGDLPWLHPDSGPSPVRLTCAVSGSPPVPARLPEVVWRAGIDVNPLDVTSADDMRWLECLIWPGQDHRRDRLAAAVALARPDPPRLVRGDLTERLPEVAAQAPAGATLVVLHSAVMAYLDPAARTAFTTAVRDLGCRWAAMEGPSVAPLLGGPAPPSPDPSTALFVVEADGVPVAYAGGQGQSLHWPGNPERVSSRRENQGRDGRQT
jgi:hypothetical protein